MDNNENNLIWDLFVELRKELVESQRIRSQMIGIKVTFIATAYGFMASYVTSDNKTMFVIPAFAAIFFDFVINSYSFSIKRIGCYCREFIEPALRENTNFPTKFKLWQEFLLEPRTRQYFALIGNFGLTILTILIGTIAMIFPFELFISIPILFVLFVLTVIDLLALLEPQKFKNWKSQDSTE